MKHFLRRGAVAIVLFAASTTRAAIELPAVIGNNMVIQSGEPVNLWGWADAGEKVSIKQSGAVVASAEGEGKDKPWQAQLPPQKPGPVADVEISGTNTITLTNVLAGEVWLCSGQSNMVKTVKMGPWCPYGGVLNADAEIAAATDNQIRLFHEESPANPLPQSRSKGSWQVCSPETVPQFSAVGYFFARNLRSQLNVPVGLIVSAVGGTPVESWAPGKTLDEDKAFAAVKANTQKLHDRFAPIRSEEQKAYNAWMAQVTAAKAKGEPAPPRPANQLTDEEEYEWRVSGVILNSSGLYNGKIHPLVPYNINGVIWYQGEANAKRPETYAGLMTDLIQGWRDDWAKPLPFVLVALAGFEKPEAWSVAANGAGSYPLIREAQIKVSQTVPNVGIACATDIGESGNIHPLNKQDVGKRAALWALDHVYKKQIVSAGPTFGSVKFAADKATIPISGNADGLVLKGPGGFELADASHKFVAATAVLNSGNIEVSATGVSNPVALRYAWLNYPKCTVYNGAGLPALPFRTDDWPVRPATTAPANR